MQSKVCDFKRYSTSKLNITTAKQVQEKSVQSNPIYHIPLLYNFGTSENVLLYDFYLEGCEMKTLFDVRSKYYNGPSD